MDSSRQEARFADMAEAAGMGRVMLYTLQQVEKVTGVPMTTLREECLSGRLRYKRTGEDGGRYRVRPEWVDTWVEERSHGYAAARAAEVIAERGMKPKVLYTLGEVSEFSGVSYEALRQACRSGALRYVNGGRGGGKNIRYAVRPEWVDQWIEEAAHGRVA